MEGKVGTAWPPYQQLPANGGSLPVSVPPAVTWQQLPGSDA